MHGAAMDGEEDWGWSKAHREERRGRSGLWKAGSGDGGRRGSPRPRFAGCGLVLGRPWGVPGCSLLEGAHGRARRRVARGATGLDGRYWQ